MNVVFNVIALELTIVVIVDSYLLLNDIRVKIICANTQNCV